MKVFCKRAVIALTIVNAFVLTFQLVPFTNVLEGLEVGFGIGIFITLLARRMERSHINGILITAVCAVLVSVTGLLTIFPYGYYQWLSQLASFSVGLACGIAYTLFLLFNQAQSNTNQPHDKRRLNP